MDLKEEQWEVVKPLLPKPNRRKDGCGRPRVNGREILNGILWVLRTGAPWHDMPERYPPYQTCHRRFQEWVRCGIFEKVLRALVQDVKERGKLDLTECFMVTLQTTFDGSFVIAKKGAAGWEKPSGGRVQSSWQWQTALVFLSPYPLEVLRRTKCSWLRRPSKLGLRR
jgi:transposase